MPDAQERSRNEGKKPDRRRPRSRSRSTHRVTQSHRPKDDHERKKRKPEELRRKPRSRSRVRSNPRRKEDVKQMPESREKRSAKDVGEAKDKVDTPKAKPKDDALKPKGDTVRIQHETSRPKDNAARARDAAHRRSEEATQHAPQPRAKHAKRAHQTTPNEPGLREKQTGSKHVEPQTPTSRHSPANHRSSTPRAAAPAPSQQLVKKPAVAQTAPKPSERASALPPQGRTSGTPTRQTPAGSQSVQTSTAPKIMQRGIATAAGPSGYNQNLYARAQHSGGVHAAPANAQTDGHREKNSKSDDGREALLSELRVSRQTKVEHAREELLATFRAYRANPRTLLCVQEYTSTPAVTPATLDTVQPAQRSVQETPVAAVRREGPSSPSTAQLGSRRTNQIVHDDLNRAFLASQNTATAQGRQQNVIVRNSPPRHADPPQNTWNTSSDNIDLDLQRAIRASEVWHMRPGSHGLGHDVVRITGNTPPTAPLLWIQRFEDTPAVYFGNLVRYSMAWRIKITLNVRAQSRSAVEFDCVVDVGLRLTDDQPQLDHADEEVVA